jgi:hypothetical protein
MPGKDGTHDDKWIIGKKFAAINTGATTAGEIIDMAGYECAEVALVMGTITDGDYSISGFEQGDESNLSDTADLGTVNRVGSLPAFTADSDDDKILKCMIKPTCRYVRASLTSTTGGTGAICGIVFRLFNAHHNPTRTTADAAATQVP